MFYDAKTEQRRGSCKGKTHSVITIGKSSDEFVMISMVAIWDKYYRTIAE